MPQRTILAPGVEVREIDESLRPELPIGTNVYVTGFTSIGPSDQVLPISSLSEWTSIYGQPTNAAERYTYHTIKGVLKGGRAHVAFNRLPYGSGLGEGFGNAYSLLAYPVAQFKDVDEFGENLAFGALRTINYTSGADLFIPIYDTVTQAADTAVTGGFPTTALSTGDIAGQGVSVVAGLKGNGSDVTADFDVITVAASGDTFSAIKLVDSTGAHVSGVYVGPANALLLYVDINGVVFGYDSVAQKLYNIDSAEAVVEITAYNGAPTYATEPSNVFKFNSELVTFYSEALRGVHDTVNGVISVTDVNGSTVQSNELLLAVGQSDVIILERPATNLDYPSAQIEYVGNTAVYTLSDALGAPLALTGGPGTETIVITREGYIVVSYNGSFYTLASAAATPGTPGSWTPITSFNPYPKTLEGSSIPTVGDQIANVVYDDVIESSSQLLGQESKATYALGKPVHVKLSKEEYEQAKRGELFAWSDAKSPNAATLESDINSDLANIGKSGLVVINDAQTIINNKFQGYYIGINDSTQISDATDFDTIKGISTFASRPPSNVNGTYDEISPARLTFSLTAGVEESLKSLSEIQEDIAHFNTSTPEFHDTVNVGIYKLIESSVNEDVDKISFTLEEGFVASLDYHRRIHSSNGGAPKSLFLDKVAENSSRNITTMVNPYISQKSGNSWAGVDGDPTKRVIINTSNNVVDLPLADSLALGYADKLFPVGYYSDSSIDSKRIGSLPSKVLRSLDKVRNPEMFDIDITVEGGLGTIWTSCVLNNSELFDDEYLSPSAVVEYNKLRDSGSISSSEVLDSYRTIFNIFNDFASLERRDHLFIADALRHILHRGRDTKTINERNNFPLDILYPLRHQFDRANTSYATVFPTWAKVYDEASDENVWVPFFGIAARVAAESDALRAVWESFAGLNRGLVQDVLDVSYNPNEKQQGQMYKVNLNPVPIFAREGIVIWGQKTLQRKPSAFDRINVRRLFLYVEKASARTSRYFVHEPNTVYTRTQVVNILSEILERVKQQGGVYDFRVICGKVNNPPIVVDSNELVVDIYIAPTRTIEFILLNFHATRTGFNFSELEQNPAII